MTTPSTTRGKLEVTVEGDAARRLVSLVGRIDESAHLDQLVEQIAAREVVIDTAGVYFLNSIGVRDWIRLLRGLDAHGSRLVLVRCSEPLVSQLNLIPNARGTATVASLHAPYLCDQCGLDSAMLLDVTAHDEELRAMKPPVMTCPECGGTMRLADLPERFFTFLGTFPPGR
jgi:anti-anti-sigma regulatory factor